MADRVAQAGSWALSDVTERKKGQSTTHSFDRF